MNFFICLFVIFIIYFVINMIDEFSEKRKVEMERREADEKKAMENTWEIT
jgi:hypothetical protein